MVAGRIIGVIAMLLTTLALLGAPPAEAGKRGWKCRSDKQCKFGTCNDAGECCTAMAGEVACGAGCCNTLAGNACCDGACVDIESDVSNCGACDNVCHGGKFCTDGVCACRSYETDCNGFCANLMWDESDCGACGNQCAPGLECWAGRCDCPAGQVLCNGQCIASDANNCGACGNVCPDNYECIAGDCKPPCDQPCHGRVGTECISLCDAGQVCDPSGQCASSCPAGYTPCGGQCVPTTPRGDGECCVWQGEWHACAEGEQCAGPYCCGAGTTVCEGDGSNPQCCYGDLICENGRCCVPDGVSGCPMPGGTGCCSYGE